jgi:glyoxylase-like metal-dependent hydrolase (beta-lactamase superfamily II)
MTAAFRAGMLVASSGKRLSTIYITHTHVDHFGLKLLRDLFPHARAITLPQVADAMRPALTLEAVAASHRRDAGAISTTSYVSPMRPRPPANSTIVCSPFIPTVSIRDRFGAAPTPQKTSRRA